MKKETIIEYLDYLSDEKINLIYDLLNLPDYANKDDLIKFSGVDVGTYDTAVPIDYIRRIEEIYPNLLKGNFIYDYSTAKFGELININNWVVNRILDAVNS